MAPAAQSDARHYVHYGCGLCAPPTWTNFDVSPALRLQRLPLLGALARRSGPKFPRNVQYGDIVRGLPTVSTSCKAVYCSHVLEHLSLEDCRTALRNTFNLLRPDGIFRLVMPDLEWLAQTYLASPGPQAAIDFVEHTHLGLRVRPRGPRGFVRRWIGNAAHLWMWDYKAMAAELESAGFCGIRRARFGDSTEPRFGDLEDPGQWHNCLGIECVRPVE